MDDSYLWTVFRYVELNPVRAGLVNLPEEWAWSSAGVHLGTADWPDWLERPKSESRYDAPSRRLALTSVIDAETQAAIRQSTRRDRPLASPDQVRNWEQQFDLQLAQPPLGRPARKPVASAVAPDSLSAALA